MIVDKRFRHKMVLWVGETLHQIKDEMYRCALANFKGNMTHASKALGISKRTLRKWKSENYGQTDIHEKAVQAEPER